MVMPKSDDIGGQTRASTPTAERAGQMVICRLLLKVIERARSELDEITQLPLSQQVLVHGSAAALAMALVAARKRDPDATIKDLREVARNVSVQLRLVKPGPATIRVGEVARALAQLDRSDVREILEQDAESLKP